MVIIHSTSPARMGQSLGVRIDREIREHSFLGKRITGIDVTGSAKMCNL